MNLKIKLILALIYYHLQFEQCQCRMSRNFLRGVALGVMFGRNLFSRQLNNVGVPPHPPPPQMSGCPMPKTQHSCSKEKHDDHDDQPVQNTFPVYVHSPTYFVKYPIQPFFLDDQSLKEFMHTNRRLLRILRS